MRRLFFDLETGGLDKVKNPILTAFFLMLEEDFTIVDELSLKLRPQEGKECEPIALEKNGINLEQHLADPETVTVEEGKKRLGAFLVKNSEKGKRRGIRPHGHNIIKFDEPFLFENLMPEAEWSKQVHYTSMDTKVWMDFLKDAGWLPQDLGTLESVVTYLGLPQREAHTAREDVLMNVDAYRALKSLMEDRKEGSSGKSERLALLETQ